MDMDEVPFSVADRKAEWHKNAALVREGFADLVYLPRGRCAWNATLSAFAYSARRALAGAEAADLNLWAAMHACPPSARYEQLGDDRLVLWHGTSAQRAEKIRQHGLFSKGGVWAATEPRIAHGFTRGRSQAFGAGSAMIVLVISKDEWAGRAEAESDHIARFHQAIPPECIEYILWGDRIEFCGRRKAAGPKPWGVARFKRVGGRWVPHSRPPVRLDAQRSYGNLAEWLDASVRRILQTLGSASAGEVFSSLYATIDPWQALEHEQVFDALERLCGGGRPGRGGIRRFALAEGRG
jgi:hypothetical protein